MIVRNEQKQFVYTNKKLTYLHKKVLTFRLILSILEA